MHRHFRKREWAIWRFRRAFVRRGAPRRAVRVVFEGQHRAEAGVPDWRGLGEDEGEKGRGQTVRGCVCCPEDSGVCSVLGATVRFYAQV